MTRTDCVEISPDNLVFWEKGPFVLNATLIYSWLVMVLLLVMSWLTTRRLTPGVDVSRLQSIFEVLIGSIREQIADTIGQEPTRYLPFIGTLYLFIALSNLLMFIPGYYPPTQSLSTTAALALAVFLAVPLYGIWERGLLGYLKHYIEPSALMLPFNVMGEVSRTVALAVRLFGNIMSGTLGVAILVSIAPLLVPIPMHALGLLIGQIQAYIFAVLALVYIASASQSLNEESSPSDTNNGGGQGT